MDQEDFVAAYNPEDLPIQTHEEFMRQAREVQFAPTEASSNRLATEYGVKGIPLLSFLSTISFPYSFLYDFMHLIWGNLLKNLLLFWSGKYKGTDTGSGNYQLSPEDLKMAGKLSKASGGTIPYAFGPRPPDISLDQVTWTANTRSFWTTYVTPPVLEDCLPEPYFSTSASLFNSSRPALGLRWTVQSSIGKVAQT
jgi:hypothetical protein